MICPNCQFDSPPEMHFCGMCGTGLKWTCTTCNFANPLHFRYCGMCGDTHAGRPIVAATPPPAALTAQTLEAVEPALVLPADREAPQPLEGERRSVSVMLADVANSTELLGQIGTEAWVTLMNHVFQIMEAEIYRFGGEVDQFRGDGLVAFFGASLAHEDDPERTILAGLALQAAAKQYADSLTQSQNIGLKLRVGIDTGQVIVASVGDRRRYSEDTVMGEAVARAARMETSAEPGTVLVSEATYLLAQDQFEWQNLGRIMVKGIHEPIAVYRPLALRMIGEQPPRLHVYGLSASLVGRETEFDHLINFIEELRAGRGRIVLVTGEGGLGKSYLINEIRAYSERNCLLLAEAYEREQKGGEAEATILRPLVWLQGRCRSYDQTWPYSVWLDILRRWLTGDDHQVPEPAEIQARLLSRCQALWGEGLADYYPYLATFLSLPLTEPYRERVKYLDAEGLRQQFYRAMRGWVEALARRGPLVLAFDDIHWADATSLDLLEYCLSLTEAETLLWLISFRADRTSLVWEFRQRLEAAYPQRLSILTLSALSPELSGEMLDQLLGPETLPPDTRRLILRKAEGNPYYLSELIRTLIQQGTLKQDAQTGRWTITRTIASIDLPDTLQSLLLSRFNLLSTEERRTLQLAAVVGTVFWLNLLKELVEDKATLVAQLSALQTAELIDERRHISELGTEYLFRSSLVRDVAYDSILSRQRRQYHHQVAEALEFQFGQSVSVHYHGMLAYHYHQAGDRRKELFYTHLAAQQAKGVYANMEALDLYSRALDLLAEMEAQTGDENQLYVIRAQKFELLNERRELRYLLGDFDGGRADAQVLLALARQLAADPIWTIDALLQQPGVANWVSRAELETGLVMAEEALSLAQRAGDRGREMICLMALAGQYLELSDPASLALAETALQIARELEDHYHEARILISISRIYNWSNEPQRSRIYLQAAYPICESLDDKLAEVELLGEIGLQIEREGDYHRALVECHRPRLNISREIGHRSLEAHVLNACVKLEGSYLGHYEAALAQLTEACQILAGTPDERFVLLRLAQIQIGQGHYRAAASSLKALRRFPFQNTSDMAAAGFYLISAMLNITLGGEVHLQEALDDVARLEAEIVQKPMLTRQYEMAAASQAAAAHLALAAAAPDTAARRNHCRLAQGASQKALSIYERFGFTQVVECISEEIFFRHSQTLAATEQPDQAAHFLGRAHDEMMRKHDLIPSDLIYRRTFLNNIPLHQEIAQAYQNLVSSS